MPVVGGLPDRAGDTTADMLSPASDGVRDHLMKAYVAALKKSRS
ncbi:MULTISPECIES: hypothetical protein [unclassified Streptomyces]|nr:hypothetical protein [Streptomyces sp. WMMC897]MCZ7412951.1 hypothetical protein [Streptomyces sp. WMMC897]